MTRDCCLTSLCLSCSDRNGSCYPRASLTLWYALTTSPRSTFPVPGKPQTHSLCLHQIPLSRPSPNLSLNVSLVLPPRPATPTRPSCSSFQNLPSPSPLKNVSQSGSLQAPSLEPSWMPGPGATSRQCSLPPQAPGPTGVAASLGLPWGSRAWSSWDIKSWLGLKKIGQAIQEQQEKWGLSTVSGGYMVCRGRHKSLSTVSVTEWAQAQSWKGFPGNLTLVPLHLVLHS